MRCGVAFLAWVAIGPACDGDGRGGSPPAPASAVAEAIPPAAPSAVASDLPSASPPATLAPPPLPAPSSAEPQVPPTGDPKATNADPRRPPDREGTATSSAAASAGAAPAVSAVAVASASAPSAPDPPPVTSEKVGDGGFSLWMQSPGRAKVGQPSFVEVVLVAKGDFHCNDKYPYKLKLAAPSGGVSYPQPIVRDASVSPSRTVLRAPFVASTPGDAHIAGTFFFSVCTESKCRIETQAVGLSVKVE